VAALTGPATPWRRRLLRAAAGAAALGAALPRGRAASGPVLTVAAFPLVDEIVRSALPAWERLHPDVALRVINRPYGDHHTAMGTALATSVLLPDVMALESSFVGRFAQGCGLEDLRDEPFGIERLRDRLVPFALEQARGRGDAVVAMPTDIGPGTLLFRHDLLERAGIPPGELSRSWDGYLAAGRRLRERTGAALVAHVQQVKDILIRTGVPPGDGLYFDHRGRCTVDSPRFARAFEVALALRRERLDAKLPAWSNEWAEALRRGALATELSGAWMVGQLSNWVAPGTAGRWRAAPLPEGAQVSYGGSFYALPRRADATRKGLAWDFVRLMVLDPARQLAAFRRFDAFPALLATHDDPFFDEPIDFLGGQPARRLWREAARRIGATRIHKHNAFADEVVGTELDHVLVRAKPIERALADPARLLERRAAR
jgi:multiple sugar transport system substrate-binding protein